MPNYSEQQRARSQAKLPKLKGLLVELEAQLSNTERGNYASERDYKRVITQRQHGVNRVKRKIKAIETTGFEADWTDISL